MARRRLSYLMLRGGVFWVRVSVPRDLRARLRRTEWKLSLKTRDPGLGRLRCLDAACAIARIQSLIRNMPALTEEQIAKIARAYLEWALKHASLTPKALADGPIKFVTLDGELETAQSAYQSADGDPKSEREAVKARLERLRADLAAHNFDWITPVLVKEFAEKAGIDLPLPCGADDEAALLRAVSRARVEENRILLAQLEGDYAGTAVLDPLFKNMDAKSLAILTP